MYCRKCGKFIDYDAEVCVDCQKELLELYGEPKTQAEAVEKGTPIAQPVQQSYVATTCEQAHVNFNTSKETGRTDGLAKGIVSLILSNFALMFTFAMLDVLSNPLGYVAAYYILALGFTIPSFCLGLSAVKQLGKNCSEHKAKPVATFVLGLIGFVFAALCLTILAFVFLSLL